MILININNKKLHYIIKKHELSPSLAPPKVALRDRRSWRCFLWPTGPCPAPDGIQLALLNHVETNNISQTNEYYIIITIIIIYYYYIYIIMDSYIIMDNYSKKISWNIILPLLPLLVGGWALPLWKIWVRQLELLLTFPRYGKIKVMFQTTNQNISQTNATNTCTAISFEGHSKISHTFFLVKQT